MDPLNDDKIMDPIIKSHHDHALLDSLNHGENLAMPMLPVVDPNDLVGLGHMFLMPPQQDGQCFCAHITQAIKDHEWTLTRNQNESIFYAQSTDNVIQQKLLSSLEEDGENIVWKFKSISAHQGPLMLLKDKDWNG
jgi:hypothetical protein